jgi:glycosyltransferase involved in cell wall biosynthesis
MRSPNLNELPPPPAGKMGWPWTQASPQLPDTLPHGQAWPLVSIVTPSYNQGQFLEETIRSVLLQGYPNIEYVIMDGGSSDDSVAIIRKYEHWLTSWCSGKDDGQADAISRGFSLCQGDILAWVNSDDLLLPGCLSKVGRYIAQHPDIDCVVGGSVVVDAEGNAIRDPLGLPRAVMGGKESFTTLLVRGGASFYQPATFWRHRAYAAAGGIDPSFTFAMDYDLYLRLASRGRFGWLYDLLACFRSHPMSKTTRLSAIRKQESERLWARYQRNASPVLYLKFSQAGLRAAYTASNLPFRLGMALGLVRWRGVSGR